MTKAAHETVGVLFLSAVLCSVSPACAGAEATAITTAVVPIQQKSSGLLCGVTKAICYSGFRTGQYPGQVNPSDHEILEDLQILSRNGNFSLIRLYDSRVNSATALRLIETHQLKLKVLLGAWLGAEVSSTNCTWRKEPYPEEELAANRRANGEEVDRAIRLANQYPSIVVAVAVGNECLVEWNDHRVPAETIIGYVRKVKQSIAQSVTVADNYEAWVQHGPAFARELDFVSVHTYAQWEGKDIDEAMPYTIANLQAVRNVLPGSRLVITEAGWSTVASEFGPRASEEKQRRYYQELNAWADKMKVTTFFFEAFDEDWKGNPTNPLGAEKHWGLFTMDRRPKLVMRELYPELEPAPVVKSDRL
jgi:exo-beta-1,3-glucanase (GH17 family)